MVEFIDEGIDEKRKVVRKMLRQENYYGFGDLQYFKILEKLAPLYKEKDGRISLNEDGKKVISGEMDFMKLITFFPKYGGVSVQDYRWSRKERRLALVNRL